METALALLGVVLVLFAAGVLSTREGPVLADAPPDAADLDLPDGPLQPEDVARLRFALAPRGYRMSEVDAVLDRLAAELAERDRRLAQLGDVGHAAAPNGHTATVPEAPDGAAAATTDVPADALTAALEESGGGADGPRPPAAERAAGRAASPPPPGDD